MISSGECIELWYKTKVYHHDELSTDMTENYLLNEFCTFYANLLAKQEPLGTEFEKVLYDNLWDLYVS